jgi:hypothetical protein
MRGRIITGTIVLGKEDAYEPGGIKGEEDI